MSIFQGRDSTARSARGLFHPHPHAFAGAAAFSGAAAGAVAGALAGPVSAVIGGILGTAVGAVAGYAFEKDERISGVHDRVLDDEIGVTRGSLGVPIEAKQPDRTSLLDAELEDTFRSGRESFAP